MDRSCGSPLATAQATPTPPTPLSGCFRSDPSKHSLSCRTVPPQTTRSAELPLRGPSPTSSLAADISQSFHIDRSPPITTPRRALFTSKLLSEDHLERSTPLTNENHATPILQSSSPFRTTPNHDVMTPIPKNLALFKKKRAPELSPPTTSSSLFSTPSSLFGRVEEETPIPAAKSIASFENRALSKPRKSRAGSLKTSSPLSNLTSPSDPSLNAPADVGDVGNDIKRFSSPRSPPSPTLSAIFEEGSPAPSFGSGGGSGVEDTFAGTDDDDDDRENESPRLSRPPEPLFRDSPCRPRFSRAGKPIRKTTNPFTRPRQRKQHCRRSLSMFERANDMIQQNEEEEEQVASPTLQTLTATDDIKQPRLPHFLSNDQADGLPRIDKSTLIEVIDGKYQDDYKEVIIIDCRFEYEYEGGHIKGASNHNDKERLAAELFEKGTKENTMLVFHCEYSAHRAPLMAKFIRHVDRTHNISQYPKLSYPELYILEGGYSSFFSEHRDRCFPQNYVGMSAKEFESACEKGLGKVKRRSKFSRAQTYTFGSNAPGGRGGNLFGHSPTAARSQRLFNR